MTFYSYFYLYLIIIIFSTQFSLLYRASMNSSFYLGQKTVGVTPTEIKVSYLILQVIKEEIQQCMF